jgi:4-amino-4-deoxy-L-arabinose transferase-like glycosyltransferase
LQFHALASSQELQSTGFASLKMKSSQAHPIMSLVEPLRQVEDITAEKPAALWTIGLFIFCGWLMFSNLGGPALLEPDEGRNAEVAREILLLDDWVTPHYDFIPRLDKPMLFFGLVALSYKAFGISEWSARLPAALAGLSCILLVYFFAGRFFGRWAALWSALVLLTSLQFFGFARVVMLEMLLTFFVSLALCCFFLGQAEVARGRGRMPFLLMYGAMGAATAIKGPIGFLLPGAVIFLYISVTRQWALLGSMQLPLGIPVFLLTAAPWYILAEVHSPGYLQYFIWEQNVARFMTSRFNRGQPWYFFLLVLIGGFFPWSMLLPHAVGRFWKRSIACEGLFLLLWVLVPVTIFSLSSSKLAHYILPVFPALAMTVGAVLGQLKSSDGIVSRIFAFPPFGFFLLCLVSICLVLWHELLPHAFQSYVQNAFPKFPAALVAVLILSLMFSLVAARRRSDPRALFFAAGVGFAVFALLAGPIIESVAFRRSSKNLARQAASLIGNEDRIALFRTYPLGLPFYLNIRRPITIIAADGEPSGLGSDYISSRRPQPAPGYGKVIYSPKEFVELWTTSKDRIVIFANKSMVQRWVDFNRSTPRELLRVGDIVVLENKPFR